MDHKQSSSEQKTSQSVSDSNRSWMQIDQERKIRNFKELNKSAKKGNILFTGSSLMEHFPICEMAASAGIDKVIYDRGIGGTTTDDFLREIDTVLLDLEPSKVFINIGTNDMTARVYGDRWMDHLFENYEAILRKAVERLPGTKIYMMAYYPANLHHPSINEELRANIKERTPENIAECNRRAAALAAKLNLNFVDANEGLADENGEQKLEFCVDGVHMYANAYEVVFNNIRRYIEE